MHKKSYKTAIVLSCIIAILGSLVCSGCRNKKNPRRVVVEAMCKHVLESEYLAERTKKLAERVMRNWANKVLDPEPILVRAGCGPHSNGDYCVLVLDMSDEEFDVAGFKVREVQISDPNAVVIEEEYRVFPENRIGNPQFLRFEVRQALSEKMNEDDWRAYIELGPKEKLATYRRTEYPVIKMALPDSSTYVEISIFDSSGRGSEAVPLEYCTQY